MAVGRWAEIDIQVAKRSSSRLELLISSWQAVTEVEAPLGGGSPFDDYTEIYGGRRCQHNTEGPKGKKCDQSHLLGSGVEGKTVPKVHMHSYRLPTFPSLFFVSFLTPPAPSGEAFILSIVSTPAALWRR